MYPNSLFFNQFTAYSNGYKYERNKTIKLEEQFSYNIEKYLVIIGGASYEYINAIPKTGDLPMQYNENLSFDSQNIYYIGTNFTDINGNDLTIIQDIFNVKYYNIGSYLQFQTQFSKKIMITAGTRYDYNSHYKSSLNPRVGIVLKPFEKLTAKILYGKAYLAPSPYKSYQHYGAFFPTTDTSGNITGLASSFWHLPNPDLEPEQRTSYDLQLILQANENIALSANFYYSQINNLIGESGYSDVSFHDVPVAYVTKTVNAGDADIFGGTLRLDYKGKISESLRANFNVSYSYSDGQISDLPLILSSKHTVKTAFGLNFKNKFNLYAKLYYLSGSHFRHSTFDNPVVTPSYSVINLTADYKVFSGKKFNASIFMNASNLLNSRYYNAGYESLAYTPQDPFRFDAGVKFNF